MDDDALAEHDPEHDELHAQPKVLKPLKHQYKLSLAFYILKGNIMCPCPLHCPLHKCFNLGVPRVTNIMTLEIFRTENFSKMRKDNDSST